MISPHFLNDLTVLPLSLREGIQSSGANLFMLIECVHVVILNMLFGGEQEASILFFFPEYCILSV